MAALDPISGALGVKRAAHLLRRATFGATKQQIDQYAAMDINTAIGNLFQVVPAPNPPKDPKTGASWLPVAQEGVNSKEDELKSYFVTWWLAQMHFSGLNITEKMTYFMHTHFTTILSRVQHSSALHYQIALYRFYALGNFKTLAKKVCLDNAMILNLDIQLNEKGATQENFAREFFELYTIGKGVQVGDGNYTTFTEQDVRESAKVLSGYNYDPTFSKNIDVDTTFPTGVVKGAESSPLTSTASRHDASTKTFSSSFQNTVIQPNAVSGGLATKGAMLDELDQLVNMIFNQLDTAKNIVRKLYRFFVYYKISNYVETNVITPLATTFLGNGYQIAPVLQQLLKCQHFFDEDTAGDTTDDKIGAIIKAPVELMMEAMRFFKSNMPNPDTQVTEYHDRAFASIYAYLEDQGQMFYEPFDVAGYDAYHQNPVFHRNWISSNYLAQRYKFGEYLIKGDGGATPLKFKIDVITYVKDTTNVSDPRDAQLMVEQLVNYVFPETIDAARFSYFKDKILLDNFSITNWQMEWDNAVSSNNYDTVRRQLENLFIAILQSPEYQLQ